MQPNYSDKHYHIWHTGIDILLQCLQLLLLYLLLCFFLINSATLIEAEAPNSVFTNECNLTLNGHFTYLYSEGSYRVINSLNNTDKTIYFASESEKKLLWESDTNYGISNASQDTIFGYLSNGYKIKIDYADTVAVYQPHYNSSGTSQSYRWAYYNVSVNDKDISTDLLYRSDRSNVIINYLVVGVILIVLYTIFKALRRDRY